MTVEKSPLLGSGSQLLDADSGLTGWKAALFTLQMMYTRTRCSVSRMSWGAIAFTAFLVVGLLAGNVGQVITLNMWMGFFPHGTAAPWTVITVSSVCFCLGYGTSLIAWSIYKRPCFRWLLHPYPWVMFVCMGFCIAANGVLLVSATPLTPEMLQAMFLSTQMVWTFGIQRILVKSSRGRPRLHWTALAFVFTTGGVILACSTAMKSEHLDKSRIWWSVLWALSVIPMATYNVLQERMMEDYEEKTPAFSHIVNTSGLYDADNKTDDMTVKLVMLTGSCICQLIWMFIMFPLDSVEWFGSAPNMKVAYENLSNGYHCLAHCDGNMSHMFMFVCAYFFVYTCGVFLNQYSATLCAIVTQMSAPLTALTLIVVPSWNVAKEKTSLGASLGAVLLIFIGAVIYTLWEESTRPHPEEEAVISEAIEEGTQGV